MKFAVGNKIKCVNDTFNIQHFLFPKVGEEYIVVDINTKNEEVAIKNKRNTISKAIYPEELFELVNRDEIIYE